MKLENIKIQELKQSPTNTPGRNEGKSFDELVASIKEKGVLMPILVRRITVRKGKSTGLTHEMEVIAGNRRLAAAKAAGLKEIPAQIREMNDVEAQEAQIVENLQREDIHPIDEGIAYRKLVEAAAGKYELKDVAVKVGKSETYIRQRLALTNLIDKAQKSLRAGKISLTTAIMLARIDDVKIQAAALVRADDYGDDGRRLAEFIMKEVYKNAAKNKPWANDKKLAEIVGDGQGKVSLFGDKELGFDPVTFGEQMARFIDFKIEEAKKKGEKMIRISTKYDTIPGVLDQDSYVKIDSKEMKAAAGDTIIKGIVALGDDLGRIYSISTEMKLFEKSKYATEYKPTAKEKAARKKEAAKEKTKREEYSKAFIAAIAKVKMPLSNKQLSAMLDFALRARGSSVQQPACTLLKLEPVLVDEKYYSWSKKKGTHKVKSYEHTLRKYAKDNGPTGVLRVIMALIIPQPSFNSYSDGFKDFAAAAKKL